MKLKLILQVATKTASLPTPAQFKLWIKSVLTFPGQTLRAKAFQLAIRLVDEPEIQSLNHQYRGKNKPTNILSFSPDPDIQSLYPSQLGDLIICAPLVEKEAMEQGKKILDHWAHLVIHGTLHLLGHDHEKPEEASVMEGIEIELLAGWKIPNPYQ